MDEIGKAWQTFYMLPELHTISKIFFKLKVATLSAYRLTPDAYTVQRNFVLKDLRQRLLSNMQDS